MNTIHQRSGKSIWSRRKFSIETRAPKPSVGYLRIRIWERLALASPNSHRNNLGWQRRWRAILKIRHVYISTGKPLFMVRGKRRQREGSYQALLWALA